MHPWLKAIWEHPATLEEAAIVCKVKFILSQRAELRRWSQECNPYQLKGQELINWAQGVVDSIQDG